MWYTVYNQGEIRNFNSKLLIVIIVHRYVVNSTIIELYDFNNIT